MLTCITGKAVTSFFKPASQREPEKITWRIVNQSLIVGKYTDSKTPSQKLQIPVKVAAFDLDDTIIAPSGVSNKWVRSETSWKWGDPSVPGRLKELYAQGYLVVFLSNQATISLKDDPKKLQKDKLSLTNFKKQVTSIFRQLDLPISIYAATLHDNYRKPRTGMWEEMKKDHDLQGDNIDMENSFYIGDAAGRDKTEKRKQDHANSDRELAANIGIKFQTPEEFFLGSEAEPYFHKFEPIKFLAESAKIVRESAEFKKMNAQDLVIFCGCPGAGKSSFYWNVLEPQGYERVNQDQLKSRDRCLKVARECLSQGKSVVVDNTNRDTETRAHWVRLSREFGIPIRCVQFTAPPRLCEHNAAVRANNKGVNPENREILPPIAFIDFAKRFVEPKLEEGFQDITKVHFTFTGTEEERRIWSKFWVSKYVT